MSSSPGGTRSFQQLQQQSSHSLLLQSKGEPRRGKGRGVRLRGGGAGRVGSRSHGDLEEESEDSSSSSTNSSSSSEEEEEREESNMGGGDKENQPQSEKGVTKDGEEEAMEAANANCPEEEEEEMEQEGQTKDKDGSYQKVTLQRPSKAKQDPSAIVPKLEAITPQTAPSTIHKPIRILPRPPIRNRGPCPNQHSSRRTPPHLRSGHAATHNPHPERPEATKKTKTSRSAKMNNGASCSSSSDFTHPRIPLSTLQGGGGEADRDSGLSGPGCERDVWVSVFRYLSRADLCVCMAVCKNWYKW